MPTRHIPRQFRVATLALLRSRLAHLVVVGTAAFAIYNYLNDAPPFTEVVVTKETSARLAESFRQLSFREPSKDELDDLIVDYVNDEILYREAIYLRLYESDEAIRRRLIMLMGILAEGGSSNVIPSDQELQSWLLDKNHTLTTSRRVTFEHVFISPDKIAGPALEVAQETHRRLLDGTDSTSLGDFFAKGSAFDTISQRRVEELFGGEFAKKLFQLPMGVWQGPVTSVYGFHIVKVSGMVPAQPLEIDNVHQQGLTAYRREARADSKRTAIETMRKRYQIVVESK